MRIKIDLVPRAIRNIHYLNWLLNPLEGERTDIKSGVRIASHPRRKQIRLVQGSFGPIYFGALKEVLPEHFSLSRVSLSPSEFDQPRTDTIIVPGWASSF